MKALLSLCFVCCLSFVMGAEEKKGPVNKTCPVAGRPVNASKTSVFTPEFCCDNCKGKFDKSPEKFTKEMSKAEKGKCIFTGRDASKKSEVVVGLCCGNCLGKFEKDPAKFMGKVKFDAK